MKKIVVLCIVVACLALAGCNETTSLTSSKVKLAVAVVDPGKVFQDSKPGQDGMAYLEAVSKEVQEEFKELQKKAAENKGQNNTSVSDVQAKVAQIQKRVTAEQQMVVEKLNDLFQKVLDQYRKEKGVQLILPVDQALSFDDSVDATADIVTAMDKESLTFEPQVIPLEKEAPNAGGLTTPPAEKELPPVAPQSKDDMSSPDAQTQQ
ncbi:MAG: OmpH family outer membrane protein [Desulfovibrionales bacterium]|nr:OmpH family outer membrane protein [Desulfovibrionales bacterium]